MRSNSTIVKMKFCGIIDYVVTLVRSLSRCKGCRSLAPAPFQWESERGKCGSFKEKRKRE